MSNTKARGEGNLALAFGTRACERWLASLQLSPRIYPSSGDAASREIAASYRAPTKQALPDGGTVSGDGRPVALSGAFDLTTSDSSVQRVLRFRHLPCSCFPRAGGPRGAALAVLAVLAALAFRRVAQKGSLGASFCLHNFLRKLRQPVLVISVVVCNQRSETGPGGLPIR